MAELLENINTLQNLDPSYHWFCNNVDTEPSELHDLTPANQLALKPREIIKQCYHIVSYEGPEVQAPKDFLLDGIKTQLGRCDVCIVEYYKSKKEFLDQLREDYNDDDVETLASMFHHYDVERISYGLGECTRALRSLPSEKRCDVALPLQNLNSIIEALTSERFSMEKDLVDSHLLEPLALVQTASPLHVAHYVPAISEFLVSDNDELRRWATSSLEQFHGKMSMEEFEFSFRGGLNRHLSRGSCFPADPDFVHYLWRGLEMIVDRLDSDLITHSLRALESNLYVLALDHIHVHTRGVRYVIQTLRKLWQISAKDFWDALGAIGPSTISDQIFQSYQFNYELQYARRLDFEDPNSDASIMVGWPHHLLPAVSVGQRPPLCRTIISQLMTKLQKSSLSPDVKVKCFSEGLNCLLYTLTTCNQDLRMSDTISYAVVVDTLSITRFHFSEMLAIVCSTDDRFGRGALKSVSLFAVQAALVLECKAIRIASNLVKSSNRDSASHEPRLWQDAELSLSSTNIALGKVMVAAMESMMDAEMLIGEREGNEVEKFNKILQRHFGLCAKILSKISSFSPAALKNIFNSRETVQALVRLIPATYTGVHESAIELVKSLTEESLRNEALRRLLDISLCGVLDGLSSAAKQITRSMSFESCPIFLKIWADIVESLCDPQDGLLRQDTNLSYEDLQTIKVFWGISWECLTVMYECSESWSMKKVAHSDILKEFVRDVMQSSETLFGYFADFDNALKRGAANQIESVIYSGYSKQNTRETQELLLSPSKAMDGVTKFLRLKDEYLLRTSVHLVRMLLSALTKADMTLPQQSSDFLAQIAIYNDEKDQRRRIGIKTLLSPTEIAGIIFDLERNIGRPIVDEARSLAMLGKRSKDEFASRDFGKTHHVEKGLALESIATVRRKSRQSTIDFGSWSSQVESDKDLSGGRTKAIEQLRATHESSIKGRSTTGLLERRAPSKQSQVQQAAATQKFLDGRKKAQQESAARRAEQAAMAKKGVGQSIAGQTLGEGSALAKIGVLGKEHLVKGENMMVSSDSESEGGSDDDFDKELFGRVSENKKNAAILEFNNTRSKLKLTSMPVKKKKVIRSARDMRARLAPQLTGLWARLLSWDYFQSGDFPPDSTKEDFNHITDVFHTAVDYRKAFEALLLLEAWSSLHKSLEETNSRSFEIKISSRITVDSLFEITVAMDFAQCKSTGLLESDIVLLSKSEKAIEHSDAIHCLGRIHRIKHKRGISEITLQVAQGPQVHSWLTQNTVLYALRIDSIVTLEREYGALVGLEWYDLCHEIIRAQVSPILTYGQEKLDRIRKVYKLNEAQSKAVQSAIDNDAFTLIQGPPGSGKTKTIVAIVGALLSDSLKDTGAVAFNGPISESRNPQNLPKIAPKKLLVCAPSNAAVDELVMRFMGGVKGTSGSFHKPNVVRLGRSDKINPQVLEVTLDEKVDKIINPTGIKATKEVSELEHAINSHKNVDKELKEMYSRFEEAKTSGNPTTPEMSLQFEKLKREKQSWSTQIERLRDSGNTASRDADIKKRQIEQKVLNEAHIICATLSGSARETFQHLTIDFETVVIDEAAQCIELSALIPLKYGCSKCIMVGDPKQLPPTVLSREAARYRYEQSLFVRLQRQQPNDVHLLDTQYRMHPDISIFPSKTFYDGRLHDGPDMAQLRSQPWHADDLLGPYRFYDVAGRQEKAFKSHSLVNRDEVEVAIALFRRLKASTTTFNFKDKIGVITPYKSQLKLLTERFVSTFGQEILKTIEFNTTDAFQGRESEIIVFSCVRASGDGIGFLSDIRRMNVGITRAKSSLWVLGSSESLMRGEYWRALILDARNRGFYTQGDIVRILKNTPISSTAAYSLSNTQPTAVGVSRQFSNSSADEKTSGTKGNLTKTVGRVSPEFISGQRLGKLPGLKFDSTGGLQSATTPGKPALILRKDGEPDLLDYVQDNTSEPLLAGGMGSTLQGKSRQLSDSYGPEINNSYNGLKDFGSTTASGETMPTDLKRKRRSASPIETRAPAVRIPPPSRKVRKDESAFIIKPRRKK